MMAILYLMTAAFNVNINANRNVWYADLGNVCNVIGMVGCCRIECVSRIVEMKL